MCYFNDFNINYISIIIYDTILTINHKYVINNNAILKITKDVHIPIIFNSCYLY